MPLESLRSKPREGSRGKGQGDLGTPGTLTGHRSGSCTETSSKNRHGVEHFTWHHCFRFGDHEWLLQGDVFTPDVVETWLTYKRER